MEEMSVGSDTQLSTISEYANGISAVALDENRVFIACNAKTGYTLRGMVCTINGDTIQSGNPVTIDSLDTSTPTVSVSKLSENKVLILYPESSSYYLTGVVATIDGNIITLGYSTRISLSTSSGLYISSATLFENKVFISYQARENYTKYLYGIVCTINGTTITKGAETKISDMSGLLVLLTTKVFENKVFLLYGGSSEAYLSSRMIAINEYRITVGNIVSITTKSNTATSVTLLSKDYIFIAYTYVNGNQHYLYGSIYSISENKIIKQMQLSDNTWSGLAISVVSLLMGKLFIAYSCTSSDYLYGKLFELNKYIGQLTTSTDDIYGIAKSNATEDDIVEVYRPKEAIAV